jgi:hypothetical protein
MDYSAGKIFIGLQIDVAASAAGLRSALRCKRFVIPLTPLHCGGISRNFVEEFCGRPHKTIQFGAYASRENCCGWLAERENLASLLLRHDFFFKSLFHAPEDLASSIR